jgi:hypothetical protein
VSRPSRRLLLAPLVLALATAALPAVSLAAAGPAAAADSVITVTGGTATTVSAPGVAGQLLGAGILPVVLPPGKMSIDLSNLTATITLPLTGGSIDLTTLSGQASAGGSIVFTKLFPLRIVRLTSIQVDIVNGIVTQSALTPAGTRVSLFQLSLTGATFGGDATDLTISNLATTITADGAQYLDSALRTHVFTAGMLFGTASSTFQHS